VGGSLRVHPQPSLNALTVIVHRHLRNLPQCCPLRLGRLLTGQLLPLGTKRTVHLKTAAGGGGWGFAQESSGVCRLSVVNRHKMSEAIQNPENGLSVGWGRRYKLIFWEEIQPNELALYALRGAWRLTGPGFGVLPSCGCGWPGVAVYYALVRSLVLRKQGRTCPIARCGRGFNSCRFTENWTSYGHIQRISGAVIWPFCVRIRPNTQKSVEVNGVMKFVRLAR
jgi:hypothetical protein